MLFCYPFGFFLVALRLAHSARYAFSRGLLQSLKSAIIIHFYCYPSQLILGRELELCVGVGKMSECFDYDVTYLGRYGVAVKGKLLFFSDRVVFEPGEEEGEKIEVPVSKIKDARLATDKDISALRVWLLGPVWGAYFKTERRLLIIDTEDELGIMRHLVFEGEGMGEAAEDLYEIRRKEKMGSAESAEPESVIKKELEHGNWRCPRCMRINAARAGLCTRCGESKPA